jgi:hypothetical protein
MPVFRSKRPMHWRFISEIDDFELISQKFLDISEERQSSDVLQAHRHADWFARNEIPYLASTASRPTCLGIKSIINTPGLH